MEPQEYDDMMRRMLAIVAHMDSAIDELRTHNTQVERYMERQDAINERLTAAIERLDVTQARIETLLQRLVRGTGNGREG